MIKRLNAVGIRSINNVVDITNYVLMEYGHPLHAFDHDLLSEGRIVVSRASEGETFTTLDRQERILTSSDLTIRDGKEAVALAGIMGGQNSEVSEKTRNILLESAYFNPSGIRRSARRIGLHSEASHRFERGADINNVITALNRAASLMAELSGGCIACGVIDVFPGKSEPVMVRLRQERADKILGMSLSTEEILKCFHNLEFECEVIDQGVINVRVPSFRVDIHREIDLIEELARVVGYDRVPTTMPNVRIFSDRPTLHQRLERKVKELLVSHGLTEVINFSFISPASHEKILLDVDDRRRTGVRIMNPLTEDQTVMRTSLLPGLLETAARNFSFRSMNLQIFEMRRVYLPREDEELPDEPLYVSCFLSGSRNHESWNQERKEVDFYDAKGIVENIFNELGICEIAYKSRNIENFYHPGKACTIFLKGVVVGSIGEIHPTVQENYCLENTGYYFELNFDKIITATTEKFQAVTPSRFPDTFRDIAMLVKDEIEAATILETITNNKIKELEGVELFDLYTGENIPQGEKSIAVRVRYRSYEKTLTDEEIIRIHNKVIDNLVQITGAVIR
jgi:phenylalanyl-tRNA synthetase beta chain